MVRHSQKKAVSLDGKTLDELRALAKARGLKGYTKLRKQKLLRLLADTPTADKSPQSKTKTTLHRHRGDAIKIGAERIKKKETPLPTGQPPLRQTMRKAVPARSEEEHVESAKYAVTLPGVALPVQAQVGNLAEDIDRLPDISTAVLCLLPQKPGVLHAYWALPPDTLAQHPSLTLRLCLVADGGFQVVQEVSLPGNRGHWYFHVDSGPTNTAFYLQLGQYRDGDFVLALPYGIARIPNLYASDQTDRHWRISEKQFREMYLRAGGRIEGNKLGWSDSFSSWVPSNYR
jgi:hypothetical protein